MDGAIVEVERAFLNEEMFVSILEAWILSSFFSLTFYFRCMSIMINDRERKWRRAENESSAELERIL